jgi:cholesterol transport system auxiliary component
MLLLAACSGAPPATYDLNAPETGFAHRSGRGQLVVYEPTSTQPIDSTRIVIRTGAEAIAYLTGAQWSEPVPRLVQARLIESFENSRLLRAVGRPGLVADYSLQTDIRHFEVDVARRAAFVEISAKILDVRGRIVSTQVFSATVPAERDNGPTVTAALDTALAKVLRSIVDWTAPKV